MVLAENKEIVILMKTRAVPHVKELLAGHSKDLKVPIIRFSKCIQVRILTGKPSVGRHVDQHHYLTLIFRESNVPGAVQQLQRVVVETALPLPAGGHGDGGEQGRQSCQDTRTEIHDEVD